MEDEEEEEEWMEEEGLQDNGESGSNMQDQGHNKDHSGDDEYDDEAPTANLEDQKIALQFIEGINGKL